MKVTICGIDTSTLPKITNAESKILIEKIKKGDKMAEEYFLRANMRLVLSIVGRFNKAQLGADDMFQVGMIGLVKALKNFDPSVGVMFSTYAVPMIVGEIRRAMRDHTSIKVSRSVRDTAYKALRAREELVLKSSKEPELVEIAEEIGISLSEVACALDAVSEPLSFYDPIYNDGDESITLLEQIHDKKENSDNWIEKISLFEALKDIPDKEMLILKHRYFEGMTQGEISADIGISQAQVSRLEKSALQRLKRALAV